MTDNYLLRIFKHFQTCYFTLMQFLQRHDIGMVAIFKLPSDLLLKIDEFTMKGNKGDNVRVIMIPLKPVLI